MRIPSTNECYQLINEMKMLDNIMDHSMQVYRVAIFLIDHMVTDEVNLNRGLIRASAMLHDVTKTRSLTTKENHVTTGAQFLYDRGYHEVGDIVRQHTCLDEYFSSELPSESEIVNYADKRVRHDKIVSLKERMNYLIETYGNEPESQRRYRSLWEKSKELEKKLFRYIPFSPEELETLMIDKGYIGKIF